MSPPSAAFGVGRSGFPRVSGDEPTITRRAFPWRAFSPRERG